MRPSRILFLCAGCLLGACSQATVDGSSSTSASSASSSTTAGSTATSSGSGTATTAGSTSGSASSTTSSSVGSTGSVGLIEITTELQLDAASYAPGQAVHGTVTYGNVGGASTDLARALITLRPPGGTHGGGPYDDLAPALEATTLAPSATATVDAEYVLSAGAATGTWEAYATYEDANGTYHDGPSVYFTVEAADAGSVAVATDGGYTVSGNTIYDAAGHAHLFHGVDRTATEWSSTGYQNSLADYQLMQSMWHANVVRIPLNQDFWLPGAAVYDSNYQGFIAQNVAWAEQAGMDVILDLHWSDTGNLQLANPGQQKMADANSVTMWTQVANAFKSDPRVIFELYNEPHDLSFDVWLNGGDSGEGWAAHGMQELYDTVRATGATNLVIVGGLDWAYDLSGVADHRVSGYNIVYNTHPYYYNNVARPPSDWDRGFGWLTATDPVIATEFGTLDCGTDYVDQFLDYADAHNMSWTAWAWWPTASCNYPPIIQDWNGTPSPGMGEHIYNRIITY